MITTSIITVNFNQLQVTIDFLNSVKKNTVREQVELILVDNGSVHDYGDEFKLAYPGLIYIRSDQNLGFAGGNNLAIDIARGKYLLFLNNDTEITDNLVDQLSSELENNLDIGLISPLILYYENPEIIQYAGFTAMNYLTCRNRGIGSMDPDRGQYNQDSRETAYCHGAAMMCRRDDLKEVGLMAEQFFLYYEELDWCERFRKAGKKIWFTGRSKIYHKESMSVGKESSIKTYFMTRNRLLFIRRNTSWMNIALFSIYYIFLACPKQIFSCLKKGRKDLVKWVFKGLLWNFLNGTDSKKLGYKI
ncbi:glycosyltransferase family 2 protein [Pedobacter sp.]|jgi:GT2 family glycosyltransferase|uniref:glycosyltransferase family 2 protein n=1 Tax=Pedobacter sp. TaxID=1411316 RepID=UPI002BCA2B14|nr:glycosyltransferase family 2 protein [Pedobacter sp.]HWW42410.1 glycosyltransferase family 2 protein [Pedobacter sp.]